MKDAAIGFFDFAEADGYIWFAANNFNALCRADLHTMSLEYIGAFPGEPMLGHSLYRSVVRCGDRLVFAPFMAQGVGEYDLEKGEFTEHGRLKYPDIKFKFETAITVDRSVYFVPQNYGYIVEYDTETGAISETVPLRDIFNAENVVLGIGSADSHGIMYVPRRFSNEMIKCNFKQKKFERIETDKNACLLINVLINDWLWMLPGKSLPIMKQNVLTGEICTYPETTAVCGDSGIPFIKAIDCGSKIIFWRNLADSSLVYDKETDRFSKLPVSYEASEGLLEKPWAGNYYFAKQLDEYRILGVSKKNHATVILDVNEMKLDSYIMQMSAEDKRQWNKQCLRRRVDINTGQILYVEDRINSLEWFLEFVNMRSL